MKAVQETLSHPFPPVYDARSRVLVLGTFPSVKSRGMGFYYGHPQNRFWRVLGGAYGEKTPETIEEKRAFLLAHGVALWDVFKSCDITGSADASIRHAETNDIAALLWETGISRVVANGRTAHMHYMKHVYPLTNIPALALPSTSPANASCSLEKLTAAWRAALLPEGDA
ncbi:MAG TPA: DNA-deoxyinosine glycosylase [Clostridia bacterium]|nr:DNA-deoxyinosine glycosylase [Clostridia bacterium]